MPPGHHEGRVDLDRRLVIRDGRLPGPSLERRLAIYEHPQRLEVGRQARDVRKVSLQDDPGQPQRDRVAQLLEVELLQADSRACRDRSAQRVEHGQAHLGRVTGDVDGRTGRPRGAERRCGLLLQCLARAGHSRVGPGEGESGVDDLHIA